MSEMTKITIGQVAIEYPAKDWFLICLSALIIITVFSWSYKTIFELFRYLWHLFSRWIRDLRIYREDTWHAKCRTRKQWSQKQDSHPLNLQGKYLKTLSFSVTLAGIPKNWRAGFVIGNEQFKAEDIVDTTNAITIHTGGDFEKETKLLPIWRFYDNFTRESPDYTTVQSDDSGNRKFEISISDNNVMQVKVQNQVIFDRQIKASLRKKVYLKAWVDDQPDAVIKFKGIRYTLRTP